MNQRLDRITHLKESIEIANELIVNLYADNHDRRKELKELEKPDTSPTNIRAMEERDE